MSVVLILTSLKLTFVYILFFQGYLPPTKNGVEPKRPSRPINITSLVRLSTTVPNTIVVSWTAEIGRVRTVRTFIVLFFYFFLFLWSVLLLYHEDTTKTEPLLLTHH